VRVVLVYEQAAPASTATFGLITSSAPSAMYAVADGYSGRPSITTATTTAVTPAISIGAASTLYNTEIDAMVVAGASPETLSIAYATGGAQLFLLGGTSCSWR
jgi:hypothetical protein